jgi:hypothetical protein
LVLPPCEAEPFEIHLSESVVRCPSSWLIEVFLEVRVSGSVVDHTFHEETFVPLRLRLYCSSSVGLPDSNVGEFLSRGALDHLRLLDNNWLGLRDVWKNLWLGRIYLLFFYFRWHNLRRFRLLLLNLGRHNLGGLRLFLLNLGRSRCWLRHILMIDRDCASFFSLKEKFES